MTDSLLPDPTPDRGPGARRRASVQDTRDRRRTLAVGGLWLLLGALVVNAGVGEDGYLATIKARSEEASLQREVRALRLENASLQQAARRLEDDATAIEEAARDMNFVYPGETLVIIHEATPARPTSPAR